MTIERPMFPPRAESVDSFSQPSAIGQPETSNRTSESPKAAEGLSRRMALAGLAALPTAAALPVAATEPDPIFAAIDTFHTADAAFCADFTGNISDEICDRWVTAVDDVIVTQPTTPAGLTALTSFVLGMAERYDSGDPCFPDDQWVPAIAAIDEAVKALLGRLA